LQSSA